MLCHGDATPLRLIEEPLLIGERLGEVPDYTPTLPLQQDLQRHQKRLRLPPEAGQRLLELDLRKPNDLERSQLLHRLNLLNVPGVEPSRPAARVRSRKTGGCNGNPNWR